jgi:hypothetical protein
MQAHLTNRLPVDDTKNANLQRSEEGGPFLG